ncbi:hypothetical protein CSC02_4229 [Enterobacter hormaechei subsp. hoffmannii]|nr:hypothetical protein CSC02_4229 [Enterobacter hormaechei subsp. hoffmannii]
MLSVYEYRPLRSFLLDVIIIVVKDSAFIFIFGIFNRYDISCGAGNQVLFRQ